MIGRNAIVVFCPSVTYSDIGYLLNSSCCWPFLHTETSPFPTLQPCYILRPGNSPFIVLFMSPSLSYQEELATYYRHSSQYKCDMSSSRLSCEEQVWNPKRHAENVCEIFHDHVPQFRSSTLWEGKGHQMLYVWLVKRFLFY